jgi:hypothetical protein
MHREFWLDKAKGRYHLKDMGREANNIKIYVTEHDKGVCI